MKKQTAGQRWLAKRMESPTLAAELKKARAEVDAVDALIRALDERRTELGMSKEDLARRVSQNPSSLRRLLTSGGNPSLMTVMEIAEAIGMVVRLEERPTPPAKSRRSKATSKLAASA